jgi:hypothetical protein
MRTYREEIRQLDSLATPAPWASDGELYGTRESGSFMPLGFAPHPFRRTLVELDRQTTPPPWDPGHLVLGMELDAELRSLGIATPKGGDPPLIAVARIAVPRALELLSFAEETIAQHGLLDGCLGGGGAVAIAAAVAAFDQHRASEGSGTGTV